MESHGCRLLTRLVHVNIVLPIALTVRRLSPDDQRGCVDWGLGDQAIGSRETQEPSNKRECLRIGPSTPENAPVTPAMHNGWPPKTENTPAAIAEESKTSATPYLPVVSMRSKEKAIPGRTLKEVT